MLLHYDMATPTASTPTLQAREARAQVVRLRRRASQTEALVRAAVLVAALATLAMGLNGVLHSGSGQVVSSLDAVNGMHSAP